MEAEQTLTSSEIQDDFIANSLEQTQHSRGGTDITTKRLKNRERQRRYRARKRLEADSRKASVINQSTSPPPPQVEVELNGHHNSYIIHTSCKRNWKKDARKVHACKNLEETHTAPFISAPPLDIKCQTACLAPEIMTEPPQDKNINLENAPSLLSSETHKTMLGRRDWKAEARNKIK